MSEIQLSTHQIIQVISDGTGETAMTMLRAGLVQHPNQQCRIVRNRNIRTVEQVQRIIEAVPQAQTLIVYTVASKTLRESVFQECAKHGIPAVDLLGPLLDSLSQLMGTSQNESRAGLLRAVDENYFRRIASVEYTVKHDDGKCLDDLDQADIVLVGISRTSKTPLSIFLSHKGYKVVNIPIVMSSPVPKELFEIDQKKIVALTIDEDSLRRIRKKRLEGFGQDPNGEYASIKLILAELQFAEDLYKRNRRWPIINVTDRSLEETAAEVLRIINARNGAPPGATI